MIESYSIPKDQKPTPEQIAEIREAAKRPIVFDEDCPEMTEEQLRQFRRAHPRGGTPARSESWVDPFSVPKKGSIPMTPYTKKVQYYETDMMGIAHHANYIRWMEEARIDFMDQMGFPYARMEAEGIVSPVRAVSCQYKRPCTFGDTLNIAVAVDGFNGVVLTLRYDMTNADSGELVCQARSEHVFMRRGGSLLRMKRDMPEFSAALEGMCPKP